MVRKTTHPAFFKDPAKAYKKRVYRTAATHPPSGLKIMSLTMGLDKSNVLEIGSGHIPTGFFIKPKKLTLVDISPDNHERARDYLATERKKRSDLPEQKNLQFLLHDASKGVPKALKGQKFSATMMLEMITHLPPEQRTAMLDKWANSTNSFFIVDRHMENRSKLARNPEYMHGEDIKAHLEKLGFETIHYSTQTYHWLGENGQPNPHTYFFLLAEKR